MALCDPIIDGKKICPKCGDVQDVLLNFHRSFHRANGYQLWCKGCVRPANLRSQKKRYGLGIEGYLKARFGILKKYGLTPEDYNRRLVDQNGVCAICHKPETNQSNPNGRTDSLRVDHDHLSGKVRGLLCSECNFGLSKFKDSPALLQSAIQYLIQHMME